MCSSRERGGELASQFPNDAAKTDARQPILVTVCSTRERGGELASLSFTYTLADAIADYWAYGENSGDCGGFVLLVDFSVDRLVTTWPDREIREIHYIGNVYNSTDTSRSLVRGGNLVLELRFSADGSPEAITRTGVMEYVVIDGRRVVTHAGRDVLSLETGPISATPKAGGIITSNQTTAEKVAALKGIQQDLLAHNRTMAADIVGKLIDVETAVKNIRISSSLIAPPGSAAANSPRNSPPKTPPKEPVPTGGRVLLPGDSRSEERASGGPVTAGRPYWVGERDVREAVCDALR